MIGQILVEKGYINLSELNEARRRQINWPALSPVSGRPPLLGDILVQMGRATPEQVEEALKLQQGQADRDKEAVR